MRNDLIELLALLVSVGYIKSFRVTKNYKAKIDVENKVRENGEQKAKERVKCKDLSK